MQQPQTPGRSQRIKDYRVEGDHQLSYAQEKFLQDGGWTMIVPASSSSLCAAELAKLEASAAEAALNEGTAPAAQ